YIVKDDGLAAGKGVFVASTAEEAADAARAMIEEGVFGESGRQVIVEDGLAGEELTVLVVTDGISYRILPVSQDHKRVFDDDEGPNTGGMGAYAPVPWAGPALMEKIKNRIIEPTLKGLREEEITYCGVLYAGLMISPEGDPRVIEYNVRFGDPEAQVVIPLLETDFGKLVLACCEGALSDISWKEPERWAANVILASRGYPGPFKKGAPISGLEEISSDGDLLIFHGATALDGEGRTVTAGGRVLSSVGTGDTLEAAIAGAYRGVSRISFDNMHYRKDIGRKALMKRSEGK
ncbi:MAG: phosphoribosylamine--glycine ligase, partial [Aminivibrio sp.]